MLAVHDKSLADKLDAYRARQTDAARAMSSELK
jgi:phosphoribosylcarboxyaminoimidazole (NCAIR) mutase